MRFAIRSSILAHVARRALKCSWKGHPIYKHVRLSILENEKLVVDSADYPSAWLRQKVEVTGSAVGAVAVSVADLATAAAHFTGENFVSAALKDNTFVLSAGRKKMKLLTADPQDFAEPPSSDGPLLGLPVKAFLSAIGEVEHARSKDASRPIHPTLLRTSHTHIEALATDGHRVARARREINVIGADVPVEPFVVPGDTFELISVLFSDEESFRFRSEKTHFICRTDDATLFAALPADAYPDLSRILGLPTGSVVRFDAKQLLETLALLQTVKSYATLVVDADGAVFAARDDEGKEAREECTPIFFEGKKIKCGIQCRHWAEYIRARGCKEVEVLFDGPLDAQLLRAQGDEHNCSVIGAMRVDL